MSGSGLWILDDGSDPGSIGHHIRVGGPAGSILPGRFGGGNVAWTDHHWKSETNLAIFPSQWLDVAQPDVDMIAGHQIRNRSGEDIGPLLFDQRRALSF